MNPRASLGAVFVGKDEIAIFGGHHQEDEDELSGEQMTDIFMFNVSSAQVRQVASSNSKSIVPVVYPCVSINSDTVLTADIYTQDVLEYKKSSQSVRVVARLPSEQLTDDYDSDSIGEMSD